MNRRDLLRSASAGLALIALDACSLATGRGAGTPAVTGSTPATTGTSASDAVGHDALPTASAAVHTPPSTASTSPPTPTPIWTPGQPATYVNHAPSDNGLVALTFHFAGAPSLATQLLDLLKANAIRSTLFAIGDWLTAHPALARRALADGHELGNHTKSHQSMLQLGRASVHTEIAGGGAALVPFIGSIGAWFRPSGTDVPTSLILEEAGKVGYPVSVGYDIDSRDYTEPGSSAVIGNVNPKLHPGAIVSLHFGHADTLTALPPILDRIAAIGLGTATVTELLTGVAPAHALRND